MMQPPGKENEPESPAAGSNDESRSADHIVQALVRAAKGLLIYPPGSSFHDRFLGELHKRLTEHLENWGALKLEIEHYEILHDTHVVYENRNPKDSLAFRIHADGIASLEFREGLTAVEVRTFLDIVNSRGGDDADDDMVTLLWSAGLAHVGYELEEEPPGEEQPLAAPQSDEERRGALRSVAQAEEPEAAETPLRRDRALDILTLTEDEERFLDKAIAFEEAKNPLDDLLEILPAMLTAGENETFQQEILALTGSIAARLLAEGHVDHALALLGILRSEAGREDRPEEVSRAAAEAIEGVGFAPEMQSPEGFLQAAGTFGAAKIEKLMELMGPGAVRPFCLLLMHELDAETEQVILEALKAPAREKPEVMTDFLSASDPVLSRKVLAILRAAGADPGGEALAGLAGSGDPALQREVLACFQSFAHPEGQKILLAMLDDDHSSVRINAARTLAGGSWPTAFAGLRDLMLSERFRERSLAEKKVFSEALALVDPKQALPFLRQELGARHTFARKREREEVLAAAAGLAKLASAEALEALRSERERRKGELRDALDAVIRRCERSGTAPEEES